MNATATRPSQTHTHGFGSSYVRIARGGTKRVRQESVRAPRVPVEDVRELLEAAGPLDVTNIAGGLGWAIDETTDAVGSLVAGGRLRADEWDRYGLAGEWR
jgi:hypothetical protein